MDDAPVSDVLTRLGLDGRSPSRFATGSLPVYAVGDDLVLKLYPDADRDEARTETVALRAVHGRLSIPTPCVEDAGSVGDWHYVLMRRLPGRGLDEVWPTLPAPERADLAERLGAGLAELHAVTGAAVDELGPRDWSEFLTQQRAAVVAGQRGLGLHPAWLARIPDYLDSVDLGTPTPVLLHTELLAEHVLVRHDGRRWTVTGLIDFEPAMRGAAEYDFAAVTVSLTRGDPALWRRFLRGYGIGAHPGAEFARRCLAYTVLHRYSNLRAYLEALPAPERPTLDALAHAWFG
ncbi:phosphotransferase family protein [Saccharomonospora saliphila]|uniref:phosphotransferase family protein n=1 Tax=Saccharomonospora saliphila TaxID=369829 RepID=UPI00036D7C8C|nr:aminoglycoside 3'-phosphotransferase/choline kinase family protein [Saccharomonospora saliphila]